MASSSRSGRPAAANGAVLERYIYPTSGFVPDYAVNTKGNQAGTCRLIKEERCSVRFLVDIVWWRLLGRFADAVEILSGLESTQLAPAWLEEVRTRLAFARAGATCRFDEKGVLLVVGEGNP